MFDRSRRRMLRAGAALVAGGLAGCGSERPSDDATPTACQGDAGRPPRATLDGGIVEFEQTPDGYRGTAFLDFRRDVDALERFGVSIVGYDADGERAFEADFGDFTEETPRTASFEADRFPLATIPAWEGTEDRAWRCLTPGTRPIARGYFGYHEEPVTEWPFGSPRTDEHGFETATGHVWSTLDAEFDQRDAVEWAIWLTKCQQRLLGRDAPAVVSAVPDPTWLDRHEYVVTYYPFEAPDDAATPVAVPGIVREMRETDPADPIGKTVSSETFIAARAAAEGRDESSVSHPADRYRANQGHCLAGEASSAYAFADDEGGFELRVEWEGVEDGPPE